MKIKLLAAFFLTLLALNSNAQEATAWRNGTDGLYPASGLLDAWPDAGPAVLWTFEELGQGHSSPVVAGNYIYTAGMTDGTGYLFKLDMEGNLVYKKAYGPEYTESFYGSRGTPVIVGDRIYFVSGYGKLMCMMESTGEKIWEVDMVKDLGGSVIKWGYNETPVVDGNIIYATPGGKNSVVAIDRSNGKLLWSCPGKGELSAYCTPLLFTHNGRKILSTHTESHLLGIDATTGKVLWTHKHPNEWSVHANTPIYYDGDLFFFSGYGQGGGKLMLNEDGTSVALAWTTPFDSRMGGAVLVDGYIYGSGDNSREWRCINWQTGKDEWTSMEVGKGVTISADGKLFGYSDMGELVLVRATPVKFDLAGKTRVTIGSEQHWAHPVIHEGVLYLRHGKALIAYQVK
ncbi:MAG: PQQ-binding-like beta-propeller repeat protein [Bacteroidales bacterium]|nr:PQQ-binding-like beta-propeller repeat protein [Bacteroidales bacterium]MDT8430459.1 PQQ-binding-like beta-propeller repeat protein [Bacteroidales bacterium]